MLGLSPQGATMAVQGFGKVGSATARLAQAIGFKVIAVSDVHGGVFNDQGLDVTALIEHTKRTGSVVEFAAAEAMPRDDVLTTECDLLVPAALERAITQHNAGQIRAKMIAEGANGPTTPAAQKILDEKGIFVLPDILANAGGVTVSYFEWVQSLQAYFWTETEVNNRLRSVMLQAFKDVYEQSRATGVNMREAALDLAVSRVAEAQRLRGIYP